MRLTEADIQQFILHSDPSVRNAAVDYFSRSFSDNASVMPFVIETVEKYGRATSVHLVSQGERLPQSECTIEWCLKELRQEFDEDDENLRDYRFAIGKILACCDLALTLTREAEILEVLGSIPELRLAFAERVSLLGKNVGDGLEGTRRFLRAREGHAVSQRNGHAPCQPARRSLGA